MSDIFDEYNGMQQDFLDALVEFEELLSREDLYPWEADTMEEENNA